MLQIDFATGVTFDGRSFGPTGAYRAIEGQARLSIAPSAIGADGIWTPDAITAGADGRITASSDFLLYEPEDPSRGNGTLLVEFVNRGRTRLLPTYCDGPEVNRPATAAQAGNGWLMAQGYSLLSVAWQGDLLPGANRLTARLPGFSDDRPTRISTEYVVNDPGLICLPLSGDITVRSYPAASTDTTRAQLTRRRFPESPREPVTGWRFERVETTAPGRFGAPGKVAVTESPCHLHLPAGFEPGWIYELVYDATGAIAFDIGFVTLGELVSALRHGTPGSPARAPVQRTIGIGQSQSGRALRDFLWRGFNRDHAGRRIFDGVLCHIAGAGKTVMNRYANLNIPSSRDYEDHTNPSDLFPFAYGPSRDHLTGQTDAILKRPDTDPLLIHSQTSAEYWHRRGSLVHTDTTGKDLPVPDAVRLYLIAGAHHSPANPPVQPIRGHTAERSNNVYVAPFDKGLLALMQGWLADGIAPPASRIPTRADGTLVSPTEYRVDFPAIPGTALPRHDNRLSVIDYGPAFASGGAAAPCPAPDRDQRDIGSVPACDAFGNDRAGLRPPMLDAPLGSYTGWNLRNAEQGGARLFSFAGAYIPLADTAEQAQAAGDPRPAILTLFPQASDYQAAITAAARKLADEGFILEDGVDAFHDHAADWGRINHTHGLGTD